jgi:hypothetical protein
MTLKYSILSIIETEIIRHELNEKHTVKTGCDDCFEAKKIFESQAAAHLRYGGLTSAVDVSKSKRVQQQNRKRSKKPY